jgi:hypothetical protein
MTEYVQEIQPIQSLEGLIETLDCKIIVIITDDLFESAKAHDALPLDAIQVQDGSFEVQMHVSDAVTIGAPERDVFILIHPTASVGTIAHEALHVIQRAWDKTIENSYKKLGDDKTRALSNILREFMPAPLPESRELWAYPLGDLVDQIVPILEKANREKTWNFSPLNLSAI